MGLLEKIIKKALIKMLERFNFDEKKTEKMGL